MKLALGMVLAVILVASGCGDDDDEPIDPPVVLTCDLVGCWEATDHDAQVDFRCFFEDGTGYYTFGDTCYNAIWQIASESTIRVETCWFITVVRVSCTESGNLVFKEWGVAEYRPVEAPGCDATVPAEDNCEGPAGG